MIYKYFQKNNTKKKKKEKIKSINLPKNFIFRNKFLQHTQFLFQIHEGHYIFLNVSFKSDINGKPLRALFSTSTSFTISADNNPAASSVLLLMKTVAFI